MANLQKLLPLLWSLLSIGIHVNACKSTSTHTTAKNSPTKQFLVVGGQDVKATEVLDFSNSNLTKPSFGEIPETRRRSVGAYLNDQPIICGGDDGSYKNAYDTCLTFDNSRWSQTHKLTTSRWGASSVILNETTLWILGGVDNIINGDTLDSTELINANEENGMPGKELPVAMFGMCAVKYSSEKIFVIGGYSNFNRLDSVWIFNPENNFNYITGPSLKNRRVGHGCALMKNGQNYLIVVGGGYNGDELSSVEILDPSNDNNQWTQGPELPYKVVDISNAMFTSPNGGGVIIAGGLDDNYDSLSEIIVLRAGGKNWTYLEQKLNQLRSRHVIISLP